MAEPRIAELIADRMATGLHHPGDPATDQQPMTIRLPLFRTAGMPAEVYQQVQLTVQLIAEAIVHLIETEGGSDIVTRTPKEEP